MFDIRDIFESCNAKNWCKSLCWCQAFILSTKLVIMGENLEEEGLCIRSEFLLNSKRHLNSWEVTYRFGHEINMRK